LEVKLFERRARRDDGDTTFMEVKSIGHRGDNDEDDITDDDSGSDDNEFSDEEDW
jgi:hypothetical protein